MDRGTQYHTANQHTANQNVTHAGCPNLSDTEPKEVGNNSPRLTPDQVREQLQALNLKPGARLKKRAAYHASRAGLEPDDLLQDALLAAMTSRRCPADLGVENFLIGIMRSIASKVIERRERDIQIGGQRLSLEQTALEIPAPDASDLLEQDERRRVCASLLALISDGEPVVEAVIDGQGHGYCGRALAEHAGIDQDDLATIRRKIKRRAAALRDQLAELEAAA